MTKKQLKDIALTTDVVTDIAETTVVVSAESILPGQKIATITVNGVPAELSAPTYAADNITLSLGDGTFKVKDGVFAKDISQAPLDINSMTLGEYLSTLTSALKGE